MMHFIYSIVKLNR